MNKKNWMKTKDKKEIMQSKLYEQQKYKKKMGVHKLKYMCGVKILHVFHLIMSIELYLLFLVRQHPYIQRYLPGTSKYDPVGAGCTKLFCFFVLWIKFS